MIDASSPLGPPSATAPNSPTGSGSGSLAGRSSLGALVFLLLALAVGVGLRVAYANHPGMAVGEWEADGFLATWEGRPWGALNRLRPPGMALALTQIGRALPVGGMLDVRLVSISFSLLGLFAACLCAASLAAISGLKRRSMLQACGWMAALWAVHPTLILSSVSPTPELLMGATACLLLAAFGLARRSPGVVSWMLCTLAAGALIMSGGVLTAGAVVVGVLVYLMPIPRAGRALVVLAGLAIALGLGWFGQRGSDSERRWMPDTAWTYSVSAMLGAQGPHPNDIPTEVDLRARQTLLAVGDALSSAGPMRVSQLWLGRLAFDLLGSRRLEPLVEAVDMTAEPITGPPYEEARAVPGLTLGLGLFDLFLRGGLLLFALTVIGLVRHGAAPSCWPRAGVIVGAIAWLLLMTAGAIGPAAVAPFDLVLLGVAGAGVVGADPAKAWTRRLAFAVGGVLLATFLWTAGWRDEPIDPWLTDVGHYAGEGRYLVSLLQNGGPVDGEGLYSAANIMSIWKSPLLRMPEPAYERASQALEQLASTPREDAAVELLVRTQVECLRYEDAARLAEDFHTSLGFDDTRSSLLLHWVQDEQRKSENLPIRRP